jgi:type I restriction enzyme, S subunit
VTDKNEIPETWSVTELGDISSAIQYGFTTKAVTQPIGPRFLRITDIQNNSVNWEHVPFCKVDGINKNKYLLEQGDLLFARTGATVGKSYLISGKIPESIFASYLIRVKIQSKIEPKYISYFFKSTNYWRQISESSAGIGQPNVNGTKLSKIKVPVAPLNEQKRIVAEIEKQFSRLDEAVENLKRVKANLKRYKASVLKAAVEGKLTEGWRKKHPDVEPADKLLERILAERRKKWEEAELAKMKAKGKVPKDDKWKKKYKEPDVAGQIDMELPNGWVIATVKQLSERVQYGSSSKTSESSDGIPVLRMGNIFEGKLLLDKLKYLPESHDEFPELLLEPDDLLFNRTNSPELVGKTAVYTGKPSPCSFASYLIRARFINGVDPNFISYFINSIYGRIWIKTVVSQQVGQANVNGTKLQALSVPLPPSNFRLGFCINFWNRMAF